MFARQLLQCGCCWVMLHVGHMYAWPASGRTGHGTRAQQTPGAGGQENGGAACRVLSARGWWVPRAAPHRGRTTHGRSTGAAPDDQLPNPPTQQRRPACRRAQKGAQDAPVDIAAPQQDLAPGHLHHPPRGELALEDCLGACVGFRAPKGRAHAPAVGQVEVDVPASACGQRRRWSNRFTVWGASARRCTPGAGPMLQRPGGSPGAKLQTNTLR